MTAGASGGSFVLDASVTLARLLDDEVAPYARSVFDAARDARIDLWAPTLWPFEVANGLVQAVRRGRLGQPDADRAASLVLSLGVRLAACTAPDVLGDVRTLAARHTLTVYDAAYLYVARRTEGRLATIDGALREAARREGVFLECEGTG